MPSAGRSKPWRGRCPPWILPTRSAGGRTANRRCAAARLCFAGGSRSKGASMPRLTLVCFLATLTACVSLPNRDPLNIDIAGIEPLPGEGLELRLAVTVRIQNPNDVAVDYSGASLSLDLNGRNLASGVSAAVGTVPRYGEA